MGAGHRPYPLPRPKFGRGVAPRRLALAATAAVLHACAPSDEPPPNAIRRDSAGITIVESLRPAWGDSSIWHVDPEPLLDLAESGTGDPHNFYLVRGLLRLSDGSLVVANRGSNEIRKFSADGSFLASAGGDGEGPGEFSNLQQIERVGDSIIARDIRSRIALFGPGLEHLRTTRLEDHVRGLHHLRDETLVVHAIMEFAEAYGVVRNPEALVLYDLEGARGDSIGSTPGGEEYVAEGLSAPPLFRKEALVDTYEGRIYTGASDRMQIEELASDGDTVRILRIPDFPLALTPEQVEAERASRLDFELPPGVASLPPPFVQAIEDMPSPETRPAYEALLVDPTGAFWLRPFRGMSEAGEPVQWLVLGSDGSWLGSVEIPEDFRVTEIGVDEVLGVWTDEMDVQHPQVRRLRRGGG